jgi:hypothetical protein
MPHPSVPGKDVVKALQKAGVIESGETPVEGEAGPREVGAGKS